MTNLHKSILFWTGIAFLGVLLVFFIVSIQQKVNTAPSSNTVSFNGEGKISIKPDMAVATFSIITDAKTAKTAQDANAKKAKAVVDFLKKQGIEERDIKTTGYNIYPQYVYPIITPVNEYSVVESRPIIAVPEAPKVVSYQVNQTMEVKIRDLDKASAVVDGIVASGANSVSNVSFQLENMDAVRAEAREKAIADAKKKAEELESKIDIRLGKIVNFYENFGSYPPAYYGKFEGGGGGDIGGVNPPLPPGESELTLSVTVTYQIK